VNELDSHQRRTLGWAGLAVVLAAFDGSVLVIALPAIATDFDAPVPALSNLGSLLALGALGALPLASLADRFGRRRLIAAGVAGFSIANFASAFAPSIGALAVLRMVAVCFEVLVLGVATALIVEEAPPGRRGQGVSVLALLTGAGTAITVLSYPLVAPNWRILFVAGAFGVVSAPAIWIGLPEGRAWQRVLPSGLSLRLILTPPWRFRLAVIATSTAFLAVLMQPAGLLFTIFASQTLRMSPAAISALIAASGLGGAASYVAGGFLTDRLGRVIPAVALTAMSVIATTLSFSTGWPGFVIGNLLWSCLASAATPVLGAWTAELFPTRARATAQALGSISAAAGGIAGLQFVGLATHYMELRTALGMAFICALAGALLLSRLPETKDAPLPP
jgi:MFS family permease